MEEEEEGEVEREEVVVVVDATGVTSMLLRLTVQPTRGESSETPRKSGRRSAESVGHGAHTQPRREGELCRRTWCSFRRNIPGQGHGETASS